MFFSSFSLSLALSVLFSLLVGLMQCILLFRDFSRLLLNQSHGLLSVHSMPLNHIRRRKVLISWNLHWIRSDFKPKNSIFKLFFSWFWNDTHPSLNLIFLAWITNIEKTRSSELSSVCSSDRCVHGCASCMCVRICLCVLLWFYDQPLFDGLSIARMVFLSLFIFTDWMRLITTSIQICDYKFHTLSLPLLTVNSFVLFHRQIAGQFFSFSFCLKSIRIFLLLCNFY